MPGYRQKWQPPPTLDDYMYEVQQNAWWNEKDRARRQLIWLMDMYLGDENDQSPHREEETALSEIESRKSPERESGHGGGDGGVECH